MRRPAPWPAVLLAVWWLCARPCPAADPRFDPTTLMRLVLVPADAVVGSVIYRLRATDEDFDYPLQFDLVGDAAKSIVSVATLPCTKYNSVCQANVVLQRRLEAGRYYDFKVTVRDTKGGSSVISCSINAINATTSRETIFPHVPGLITIPEDAKKGTDLDYVVARKNPRFTKPVYLELWGSPLFAIRQRLISDDEAEGTIFLLGPLDYEKQATYHLTVLANDAYAEPGQDSRNIAELQLAVVLLDVQDEPPVFTRAPPVTRLDAPLLPGDVVARVRAEDGDRGKPRPIRYGLVSEGNPFTMFFNISETTGEIVLARPLEEITAISHAGDPILLTVVAEEVRLSRNEPEAMSTTVQLAFILGDRGNEPPYFSNENYVARIDENAPQGSTVIFSEPYLAEVSDDDMGKNGVFALTLENNNGTFEISPNVGERHTPFLISVRDNTLLDYEERKTVRFKIVAQELGPSSNLSTSVDVLIFLNDVNDNSPVFLEKEYYAEFPENATVGTRVTQVTANDSDTGIFAEIRYTQILGHLNTSLALDPKTGLITLATSNHGFDCEVMEEYRFYVEATDENGIGNRATVPLIIKLIDVNDEAPQFDRTLFEFILTPDLSNFTYPAFIKATDKDISEPNNIVRYELVNGNYEDKFVLNEVTGELTLREPLVKKRSKRNAQKISSIDLQRRRRRKNYNLNKINNIKNALSKHTFPHAGLRSSTSNNDEYFSFIINRIKRTNHKVFQEEFVTKLEEHNFAFLQKTRTKRSDPNTESEVYTLTARAYDLGVPHLSSTCQINVYPPESRARTMLFVVPGKNPDRQKTEETLAAITGGKVTIHEIRPYSGDEVGATDVTTGDDSKERSVVLASVTYNKNSVVDVSQLQNKFTRNRTIVTGNTYTEDSSAPYRSESNLLFWLLLIFALLILLAIIILILCCICVGCPLYMPPKKRIIRISSTDDDVHLMVKDKGIGKDNKSMRKEAWSADNADNKTRSTNWQFNKRHDKEKIAVEFDSKQMNGRGETKSALAGNRPKYKDDTRSLQAFDGPNVIFSRDLQNRYKMNERDIYLEDYDTPLSHKKRVRDEDEIENEIRRNEREIELRRKEELENELLRRRENKNILWKKDEMQNETMRLEKDFRRIEDETLRLERSIRKRAELENDALKREMENLMKRREEMENETIRMEKDLLRRREMENELFRRNEIERKREDMENETLRLERNIRRQGNIDEELTRRQEIERNVRKNLLIDEDFDNESLKRHEIERGSDKEYKQEFGEGGSFRRSLRRQHATQEDQDDLNEDRDQLFIREGNTEILRLITRGGEEEVKNMIQSQRPVTLVQQPQYILVDSGKHILMERFIEQQLLQQQEMQNLNKQIHSSPASIILPNEVLQTKVDATHASTKNLSKSEISSTSAHSKRTAYNLINQELLETSLRQQNELLKKILLEKEKLEQKQIEMSQQEEFRLETQSLPGHSVMATQTDCTTSTQTEFQYLRPPERKTRSDNDESGSEEEDDFHLYIIRHDDNKNGVRNVKRRKKGKRKRDNYRNRRVVAEIRKQIKTPILEESESPLDSFEKTTKDKNYGNERKVIIQKGSIRDGDYNKRSPLKKDVLIEISESLENNEIQPLANKNINAQSKAISYESDTEAEDRKFYSVKVGKLAELFSEDSLDYELETTKDETANVQNTSTQDTSTENNPVNVITKENGKPPFELLPDEYENDKKVSDKKKSNLKSTPRYMQWYNKKETKVHPKKKETEESSKKVKKTTPKITKSLLADTKSSSIKKVYPVERKGDGKLEDKRETKKNEQEVTKSNVEPTKTETSVESKADSDKGDSFHPLLQHSEYRYEHPSSLAQNNKILSQTQSLDLINTPVIDKPPNSVSVSHKLQSQLQDNSISSPKISPEKPPRTNLKKDFPAKKIGQQPILKAPGVEEDYDSGIAMASLVQDARKRNQITEKKSIFTIAYDDMHTKQLRPDSTTPPY